MKSIPNLVTLINVFSGSLAAVFVMKGQYQMAFLALLVAFVADYADGLLARVLDARSELGLQLDSLADMVSFGFVPGLMLYQLITRSQGYLQDSFPSWLAYGAFIYTAFAALRLGRFNIDDEQSYHFRGLPTPAAGAAVFGVMIIEWLGLPTFQAFTSNGLALLGFAILLAVLMNVNFRVFSFKMWNMGWRGNELKYITLVLAVVLLFIFKEAALLPAIGVYVLLSLLTHVGILPFDHNFNPAVDEIPSEN